MYLYLYMYVLHNYYILINIFLQHIKYILYNPTT